MINLEYVDSIGLNQSGQDLCCLSVDSYVGIRLRDREHRPFNIWSFYNLVCASPVSHCKVFSNSLTHCSLETPKRVIGKECRPRSDT